jgi:2-methylisocitrate lyase-like PEP mutase family enzyme
VFPSAHLALAVDAWMSFHVLIMPTALSDKVARFRSLHTASGAFVIPNPWDAGSARILAGLGFPALATSSAASAGTLGRRDYAVKRAEALAMAQAIVDAVDLPVSGDLENGFGDAPENAAETIVRAAEIGLAGGSIEDAAGGQPPYDLTLATERIAAAVEAARKLSPGFVLMARAENFVRGRPDLDDTIKRLQAYERAGADVLAAPGLPDLAAVRAVCAAVKKPVNYMTGAKGRSFSVAELSAAGVKRISLATAFYRAAMTGLRDAAAEVKERGTFTFADRIMTTPEVNEFMSV